MATSSAKTVAEDLESLPKERRAAIGAVRKVVRESLPKGYKEAMGYGSATPPSRRRSATARST